MGEPFVWFVCLAALASLAWCAGLYVGRLQRGAACGLTLGVATLAAWAYLAHHPAVAVQIIPLGVLSHIEGTAAVPIFMFIIGILFTHSHVPRQKRVAMWAALLGAVYFLQGGMWMLQTTPLVGFAKEVQRGAVLQSQEYSCVPAACATALNAIGVYTSEAEMAQLTLTRPATGATTIRALRGLNLRLQGSGYRAILLDLTTDELARAPLPILTPLQFERTRRHMVTIRSVGGWGVEIDDPMEGTLLFDWQGFREVYTGQAIVFVSDRERAPLVAASVP